jgi:hypothetical protein
MSQPQHLPDSLTQKVTKVREALYDLEEELRIRDIGGQFADGLYRMSEQLEKITIEVLSDNYSGPSPK